MTEAVAAQLDSIKALAFSDLYLEPDGAWYKKSPGDRERRALLPAVLEEARAMRVTLQGHKTGLDFRAHWEGVDFRVQRLETLNGDVYVCRRLLDKPIAFDQLGYSKKLQEAMLTDSFTRSGLVLFTGATGDGKSMTQASWLLERLRRFGGTACTVENPIEIILQGQYGTGPVVGTCYQTEVRADADFATLIVRLLRAAPNMIMLGEIRSRDVAAQAVLAGTSGHLVSSTLHANDLATALERLKNMTREAGLDVSFLADALCAVFHQEMSTSSFGGKEVRSLKVTPLIISGATNETGIRANLRSGDFSLLASEIERQKRLASSTADQQRF